MAAKKSGDRRIVMTLDAGGTNLKFSAIQGGKLLMDNIWISSEAHDLDRCLGNIVRGFEEVRSRLPAAPVAISFAFPGPTDYTHGIVGDLPNLPAFRGGVALGPMLEEKFKIPVFMNNDGDLFAYGEALAGFLPAVNAALKKAGSPKRYQNLFGVTLGTGFGGGIVRQGVLFRGDNICAGEVWLLRNKLEPWMNAEEGCCIRAVRRVYAKQSGIPWEEAPPPKEIFSIANGRRGGNPWAAREAFRRLGEVAGDAIAQAVTLVDALVVIGGGIAGACPLFMPALVDAMNDVYHTPGGEVRRLVQRAFNFEDKTQRAAFLKGDVREITVPGGRRRLVYDAMPRTAVGRSCLGTSEAVAVGAYAFALERMDQGRTRSN